MNQIKHWQDGVSMVVGIWVALSAWFLGYGDIELAMYNGLVVGIALVAAAVGAMLLPRAWEEWTELGLGLWLAVSPWLLGFSEYASPTNNAVASGLLVLALALWVLMTDQDFLAAGDRAAR
jgi:hypothetical protein